MERGRVENGLDSAADGSRGRKRSRSISSYSSDSVSTISTNRSLSPKRSRFESQDDYIISQQDQDSVPRHRFADRKRRRDSSYSRSDLSDYSTHQSLSRTPPRNTRRRHKTISPECRGRSNSQRRRRRSRTRSRSHGMERSRIARERYSMTPQREEPERGRCRGSTKQGEGDINSSQANRQDRGMTGIRPEPLVRKERSLSPYSKRLALTQAMNLGR